MIEANPSHDEEEWLQTRRGEHCLIRVPAAATNGAYSLLEIVSDPGDGTPLHIHANEDEHVLVLEGRARIAYDGEVFDAPAGTFVNLAKGIPHAWCNASHKPVRMAFICYPGGVEEALREVARGGDVDLNDIRQRYGVEVVGPPLI